MTCHRKANNLINEKSPYLLQHAYNPIHWYPWSEEAFEKAKKEDKPVFLSIGYSTCHWCHVMERESFEDDEVAEVLNKNYVSIKVDREERPDLDNIYMSVCTALTGHGGWPLTIIMTPDKKPFFAGTYFPKENRMGMSGLIEILEKIIDKWEHNKEEINHSTEKIINFIRKSDKVMEGNITDKIINRAFNGFRSAYDDEYGGIGTAPKFPSPHNLMFLLRYWKMTDSEEALKMITNTLNSMYKGGIFDHIGYGFSRYSTDRKWLVPHFEKMLYDNALLALSYLEAYQAAGDKIFSEIADMIFTYVLRDMTSEEGGFFTAEDADSEGVEGKFYLWTPQEVIEVLGEEKGQELCSEYDITPEGNFEGKNISNLIGNKKFLEDESFVSLHKNSLKELFEHREKRVHPYKDDKVLTSWNGMMIAALAVGARVLGKDEYKKAAEKAVEFIYDKLIQDDGRILARYRDGESAYLGYVDDYAFLVWGLIELYETTFNAEYLQKALKINEEMLEYFWDEENGGLFFYGKDSEQLILKPKEAYDGAIPSGNSVAAMNMLRLARLTGNGDLENKSLQIFNCFAADINKNPMAFPFMLSSYIFYSIGSKEMVIVGDAAKEDTNNIIRLAQNKYLPFTVVLYKDTKEQNKELLEIAPFIAEQKMIKNKATAYICENFSCREPLNDINEIKKILN